METNKKNPHDIMRNYTMQKTFGWSKDFWAYSILTLKMCKKEKN